MLAKAGAAGNRALAEHPPGDAGGGPLIALAGYLSANEAGKAARRIPLKEYTTMRLTLLLATVLALATPAAAQTYATGWTVTPSACVTSPTGPVTVTATPNGGAWPPNVEVAPYYTPQYGVFPLQGTFSPNTSHPTGTAPVVFTFTPTSAGTGCLQVNAAVVAPVPTPTPTATPAPTPAPTPTSTPAPTPTPTPTPAPASDGTLTGLPATIVAGQPLSAVTYGQPQPAIYFVPYRVAGAVEEGVRWASTVMPGNLTLLIPQTGGAYTVRGYSAATGGSVVYESAQFNVTAAPGALPATPTQTADTGATSSSVTTNWTATGTSYRVLARPGVGGIYGSLADTTVSTNSFTFTGRPASSSPRAVVIPQNANGYGTPSGQFLSYITP